MRIAVAVSLLLLSSLRAQRDPIELPLLLRLGAVPASVPAVVTLRAQADDALPEVAAGTTQLALRAARTTPMAAVQRVIDHAPPATDALACHLATMALFQVGGADWTRWVERLSGDVVARQATDGPAAGNWAASPGATALVTTARYAMSSSTCYRYSRIVAR
jgi:hypothetical protein